MLVNPSSNKPTPSSVHPIPTRAIVSFQIYNIRYSWDEAQRSNNPHRQEIVRPKIAVGRRRILHDLRDQLSRYHLQGPSSRQYRNSQRLQPIEVPHPT